MPIAAAVIPDLASAKLLFANNSNPLILLPHSRERGYTGLQVESRGGRVRHKIHNPSWVENRITGGWLRETDRRAPHFPQVEGEGDKADLAYIHNGQVAPGFMCQLEDCRSNLQIQRNNAPMKFTTLAIDSDLARIRSLLEIIREIPTQGS